jgi:hypothetical protein
MEVIAQVGRDHPVDLKRVVMNPDGAQVHEHLLTIVPVSFRRGTAKFCFLGRSDVHIVRQEARKQAPPESSERTASGFTNLAMTLQAGTVVKVGPGLLELSLIAVSRGLATIKAAVRADGLLLNLEPLAQPQELSLRRIIERLNQGQDYRSDAL